MSLQSSLSSFRILTSFPVNPSFSCSSILWTVVNTQDVSGWDTLEKHKDEEGVSPELKQITAQLGKTNMDTTPEKTLVHAASRRYLKVQSTGIYFSLSRSWMHVYCCQVLGYWGQYGVFPVGLWWSDERWLCRSNYNADFRNSVIQRATFCQSGGSTALTLGGWLLSMQYNFSEAKEKPSESCVLVLKIQSPVVIHLVRSTILKNWITCWLDGSQKRDFVDRWQVGRQ